MSANITLSNLAWSTQEGRELFSGLDFSFAAESVGLVGRNGVGKTTLLKLISGELVPTVGAVSVTGTLAFVRQSLQVEADAKVSDLFGATEALAALRRVESGTATLEELADADWTVEERIRSALGCMAVCADPDTRLASLSGGEHTRAALASAVFRKPDFLLLDEPTNNLDQSGREAVQTLLRGWSKGAIVASHDRELLEAMDVIVELTSIGTARYGGGWSAYRERKEFELAAAERNLADAQQGVAEVERNAQATTERQQRRDAGGRRKATKGGMPKILIGTRKNRAEATGGASARMAERQRMGAVEAVAAARERVEVLQNISVSLPSAGLPAGKPVLALDRVTFGFVAGAPIINDLSFTMVGSERVALTGPNGCGKTTLLNLLCGIWQPWSGQVRLFVSVAMLDQRAAILEPNFSIRDNFLRINEGATENACRAALARFAFRADAALQIAGSLSGGQLLRAALACVLGGPRPPQLLILDEPTNHLDLASIQAIEAALETYDGALLVVSHDAAFVEHLKAERQLMLGLQQRPSSSNEKP